MDVEEFTEKFAACFSQTESAAIKPETEFRSLEEWGSMMTLIVIAMVDSDYGKILTAEDLKSAGTVAELFDLISKK